MQKQCVLPAFAFGYGVTNGAIKARLFLKAMLFDNSNHALQAGHECPAWVKSNQAR